MIDVILSGQEKLYRCTLIQMYIHEKCDAFYLYGDLNSRVGSQQDFIEEVDEVAQLVPIDLSKINMEIVYLNSW